MKHSLFAVAILLFVAVDTQAQTSRSGAIRPEEVKYQNEAFEHWWGSDLVWKFDDLPTQGVVKKARVPYSGYIYPDNAGGTLSALRKYDEAFHRGRNLAAAHEQRDIEAHKETQSYRRGLFGWRRGTRRYTPGWHGHCNGWTAAAIRHAAPQTSVRKNGVVFTPADIRGLLAEVYMYCDTEFLGGVDSAINPGTLHTVLCNWIGRGSHPIGMDTTVGKEVWNFPIYSFGTWSKKVGDNQVEVKTTIAFINSIQREAHSSPLNRQTKYFHYMLDLDDEGKIVGGRYMADSSRIDFLWAPLKPVQGGQKGNELGNPYLNVKEILAIWRASVPEEARANWMNIDPTEEDRVLDESGEEESTEVADAGEATPETPADEPEVATTDGAAEEAPATESSAAEADAATATDDSATEEPATATP